MCGGARWVRMWVVVEDGGEVVCEWGGDWREEERGTRRERGREKLESTRTHPGAGARVPRGNTEHFRPAATFREPHARCPAAPLPCPARVPVFDPALANQTPALLVGSAAPASCPPASCCASCCSAGRPDVSRAREVGKQK